MYLYVTRASAHIGHLACSFCVEIHISHQNQKHHQSENLVDVFT